LIRGIAWHNQPPERTQNWIELWGKVNLQHAALCLAASKTEGGVKAEV
jgi:hypothetical protein